MTEVQPNRLKQTPHFDKDGRPLRHLDIEKGPKPDYRRVPHCGRRDELVKAIADAGLRRPATNTAQTGCEAEEATGEEEECMNVTCIHVEFDSKLLCIRLVHVYVGALRSAV